MGGDEEAPFLEETLRGMRMLNVVPSTSVDATSSFPPWANTICDATYNPKPRPVFL